jgi:hypothetical protein
VLRVTCPYGEEGRELAMVVSALDRDGVLAGLAPGRLTWRFASNGANDVQPRNVPVDRVVARLFADRAKQEAIALNRDGRYEVARDRLRATARRIRSYAGHDAELLAIVEELEREAEYWTVVREESTRKLAYADAMYSLKRQMPTGASMRIGDRPPRSRA